jgi:4-hydroxy-tetrahydrodipicolinate reductase
VCIAGVSGHIGRPLAIAVSKSRDLRLVGAVSRSRQGCSTTEVTGDPTSDVLISGSVAEALKTPTDVYVDFTSAEAVKDNVLAAIESGVHTVIGTSGLTDEDYVTIDAAAHNQKLGVIAADNFSMISALLEHFAYKVAECTSQWKITDCASDSTFDYPSSTVRELSFDIDKDERLIIRHDVSERHEACIQGALLAIRKVRDRVGLVRGLGGVMAL